MRRRQRQCLRHLGPIRASTPDGAAAAKNAKERSHAPHANLTTQGKAPFPPPVPHTQRRHSHAWKHHLARHRMRDVLGRVPRRLGSRAARTRVRQPRRRRRRHGGRHRHHRRWGHHHRRSCLLRPARHLMDPGLREGPE